MAKMQRTRNTKVPDVKEITPKKENLIYCNHTLDKLRIPIKNIISRSCIEIHILQLIPLRVIFVVFLRLKFI